MNFRPLNRLSSPTLQATGLGLMALSLLFAATTMVLGERAEHAGFLPISFYVANDQRPILLLTMTFYALLGGLLTWRLPRLSYGWLWSWLALTLLFIEFARWYTAYNLFLASGTLPLMAPLAWLTMAAYVTALVLMAFLMLLFPAGRLPSRHWRPLGWALCVVAAIAMLAAAFLPGLMNIVPLSNPYPLLSMRWVPRVRQVRDWAMLALLIGILLSGVSVFVRLRRAHGVERQQVKWFGFAALLLGLFIGLNPLWRMLNIRQYWVDVWGAAAILLLALAMALAVLRYRLYDIDLLIRRTLSYTIVTLLLGALYLGLVILSQTALVQLTGQSSPLAIVLSTLAIAALFNPLRMRIQDWIDRRFFRAKYDPQFVIETFNAAIRDETDPELLRAELESVLRETMQPTALSIWLRRG